MYGPCQLEIPDSGDDAGDDVNKIDLTFNLEVSPPQWETSCYEYISTSEYNSTAEYNSSYQQPNFEQFNIKQEQWREQYGWSEAGIHGPKPIYLKKVGLNRTRTKYFQKVTNQLGP